MNIRALGAERRKAYRAGRADGLAKGFVFGFLAGFAAVGLLYLWG